MLKDLAVPICVTAVLASLLLPLPTVVIDFLLVVNLLLALVLLASGLYLSDPLKLSALPTMLLLATLFRLALNVSTTRLILNSGEAGRVIEAFGEVVIQGNLIVGAVVFLIITIIQFLVIAKGAERVAEVAARFTLDALPGKQMSIDADVRAGLIDFDAARTKRQELQIESRFYGALDGAMKFIKGDAIAGLIVTAINIVGGFLVGVGLRGLDFGSALRQYTILTVGDGLASQVPALLNALAAAIIVTRVSKGDGQSLAKELPAQLGQLRSVKVMVAVFALLLGFVPHMPIFPFVSMAMLLASAACFPSKLEKDETGTAKHFEPRTPSVLSVELGAAKGSGLRSLAQIGEELDRFRQRMYDQTGLVLNAPEFSLNSTLEGGYRILVRGVLITEGTCAAKPEELLTQIIAALEDIVLANAAELVDDILTRRMLDRFDREAPELVAAVVPGMLSVTQLTEILRALVQEKLPIRNFDLILQAVAETGAKARNERMLLEEVRIALRRLISARYRGEEGKIRCFALDTARDLELSLVEREGRLLNTAVLEKVAEEVRLVEPEGSVILTSRSSRRIIRDALVVRGVFVPVIAYEEVVDMKDVAVLGSVGGVGTTDEVLEALAA